VKYFTEGSGDMRILISTIGTRGDVQPYIALAVGLQRAGHHVKLATAENFASLVASYPIEFIPLPADIQMLMQGQQGQKLVKAGTNPVALTLNMRKMMRSVLTRAGEILWEASEGADVIISHFMTSFFAHSIAKKRGIRYIHTLLQPVLESKSAPSAMIPRLPFNSPLYNRLTGLAGRLLLWKMYEPHVNRLRRELLAMPPLTSNEFYESILREDDILFAYSQVVAPKPEDWPNNAQITGYWILEESARWTPPDALEAFLEAGEAPVYIGFGSMNSSDPRAVAMTVLEALKRTGQRAIISSGWGGLEADDLPKTVFAVEGAPHEWLFPRMSAIVHHGGAGTTAAALRAGVPSMVVPFLADQPFWGHQVASLGVGPAPISIKRLNADKLTSALAEMRDNREMRVKAAALGECLRQEDGVANAMKIITG
jgi:sterol 3beta-glucosyltransferase